MIASTLTYGAEEIEFDYDEIGQLTAVVDHLNSDAVVETYDYDANGNRISSTVDYGTTVTRTYAYNADDQLTAINGDEIEYDYDLDSFLTERRRDTGSSIETTGYVYNTRGELLSVDLPAGGSVERVEYTYDPLGRRIARRAYDDEDALLSTEKYLWNGLTELLAVYDGSNQLQQRFDYLGGGLPVGVEIWDGTGFDYFYLAYDQIGSLRYVFDEAGSVAKAITYDAFGNVLSDSNPGLNLQIGFAGGHTDRDTGLVRFVARDYDPEIGRWTAGDPIGIQGGLNAYLYVGNNPANATDPFGLAQSWGERAGNLAYQGWESLQERTARGISVALTGRPDPTYEEWQAGTTELLQATAPKIAVRQNLGPLTVSGGHEFDSGENVVDVGVNIIPSYSSSISASGYSPLLDFSHIDLFGAGADSNLSYTLGINTGRGVGFRISSNGRLGVAATTSSAGFSLRINAFSF